MKNEIWKDVIGYIRLYQVSNYGRIKSSKRQGSKGKILKSRKYGDGYNRVVLHKNGMSKYLLVHRIVLETFIGPCPVGMEVCHKDGNPENNFIKNLRYDTHKNNMQDKNNHSTMPDQKGFKNNNAKLNNWQFRIIKRLLEDNYLKIKEIAEIFNVHRTTIYRAKNNNIVI